MPETGAQAPKKHSFSLKKLLFGTIVKKILFGSLLIVLWVAGVWHITITQNPGALLGSFGATSFIVVLFAVLISISVAKTISIPIQKLHKATEAVENGNFRARVDIRSGDEIEALGRAFNKTTAALEKMDDGYKQLEHAKTEFLSITSHELRSPMTPMKGQLQMLLGGYFGKINDKQKNALDIVLRNIDRLDHIILDLLEISRVGAVRLKFNFVKTDLTPHIRRLVEEMNAFMVEKNIEIVAKIGKLPEIETDPDKVMEVLRNLINNAKKFSPADRKVFVDVALKDNMIQFSVRDQGIGISAENQDKVFEPFFQAEQTMYRKSGGTGLGLSICKGIVEAQNGKLWLESEFGTGTTFYFTIPFEPVREIKPIKMLFSQDEEIEQKVKKILIAHLGAIGDAEFTMLKQKTLDKILLLNYIAELQQDDVIDEATADEMAQEIISIYNSILKVEKGGKDGTN